VITVISDTHRENGHGLSGRTREAVREAGLLVHAGDFTTPSTFEALREVAGRIEAVHGNRDDSVLCDRLPARRTVECGGVTIALVHGHEHDRTSLSLLGRAQEADMVVFGHSHRPVIVETGDVLLLNPGSHADPRGNPASHAELTTTDQGVTARLLGRDGDEIDATRVK
jgi:putative phosphoesterase